MKLSLQEVISAFRLNPNYTKEELRKSYRNLTKLYHPDLVKDITKKKDNEKKFKKLTELYTFLLNNINNKKSYKDKILNSKEDYINPKIIINSLQWRKSTLEYSIKIYDLYSLHLGKYSEYFVKKLKPSKWYTFYGNISKNELKSWDYTITIKGIYYNDYSKSSETLIKKFKIKKPKNKLIKLFNKIKNYLKL